MLLTILGTFPSHAAYYPFRWPESAPIQVRTEGDARFKRMVKDACKFLQKETSGSLTFQHVKKGGVLVVTHGYVPAPALGLTFIRHESGVIMFAACSVNGMWSTKRRAEREAVRLVLMHELLHAAGMSHSPNSDSIMFFEFDGHDVSAQDVLDIQQLYQEWL